MKLAMVIDQSKLDTHDFDNGYGNALLQSTDLVENLVNMIQCGCISIVDGYVFGDVEIGHFLRKPYTPAMYTEYVDALDAHGWYWCHYGDFGTVDSWWLITGGLYE